MPGTAQSTLHSSCSNLQWTLEACAGIEGVIWMGTLRHRRASKQLTLTAREQ